MHVPVSVQAAGIPKIAAAGFAQYHMMIIHVVSVPVLCAGEHLVT